jgi:hypothetical protein
MIDVKFLEQYPEFLEFKTTSNTESTTVIDTTVPTTPTRSQTIRSSLDARTTRWGRKGGRR